MRAAARRLPQRRSVFLRIAAEGDRKSAPSARLRDFVEPVLVAARRHDSRSADGERNQDGGGAIGPRGAVDDDGLAGGQTTAPKAATGHDAARDRRKLKRFDMVKTVDRRHDLRRQKSVFGERSLLLRFPPYRHMKFGGIVEGTRWIWIEGVTEPFQLDPGDFYLLSEGAPYCFASDVNATPVDGLAFMTEHLQSDGIVRFHGGEGRSVGVGGRFVFDDESSGLLLSSLPPLIRIRADDSQARALRAALELIVIETQTPQPGGAAIAGGLRSVVLVNILRAHLLADERPQGWLGALSEKRIGAALKLMHADIARRWTVNGLANAVGMSRTSFAERFKSQVGVAPMGYLTGWRMTVARRALRRDDASLAQIAVSVGYESDTAFSLAFKRRFGGSPGRYRRHRPAAPASS